MILFVIFSIVLATTGILLYWQNQKNARKAAEKGEAVPTPPEIPAECCGQHEICERDSLLAAVSQEITYYDDEELDAWKGVQPDKYDDEQISTFREILYTMKSEEVAGWIRSLQLRNIALPNEIKDEVLLIVSERRMRS